MSNPYPSGPWPQGQPPGQAPSPPQGAPPQYGSPPPLPQMPAAIPGAPYPPGQNPVSSYPVLPYPAPNYPIAQHPPAPQFSYPPGYAVPQQPISYAPQAPAMVPQATPVAVPGALSPLLPIDPLARMTPPPATPPSAPASPPATTGNRPLPLPAGAKGVRPIPLPAGAKTGTLVTANGPSDETENENEVQEKLVKSAPPWAISLLVHMAILIFMALIYVGDSGQNKNAIEVEVRYAEEIGEQLNEETFNIVSPVLTENTQTIITPADLPPVADPLAFMPKLDFVPDGNVISTNNLDAKIVGMALQGRSAGSRQSLLAKYGGNATTEESVLAGLEWLKRNQLSDGSWSLQGPYAGGANTENTTSATAMAMLAFLGHGDSHKAPGSKFKDAVQRGMAYLIKNQRADGDYFKDNGTLNHYFYSHAQATIAMAELYGLSRDEEAKKSAVKAIEFLTKSQDKQGGGWRYQPGVDSDTSVTGWGIMALQSGRMVGIAVPYTQFELASRYLDSVANADKSEYRYQVARDQYSHVMTAEALLCRQWLGWKTNDPRMLKGADVIMNNMIDYNDQNVYYWYYATQVLHHMGHLDDRWKKWNAIMRDQLPRKQEKSGDERGSWSAKDDQWGFQGGRLFTTCIQIYMLEVYYRHTLSVYKSNASGPDAPEVKSAP